MRIAPALLAAATLLAGCATTPMARTAGPANVPPGMQYLYGSGEAAALSEQAYNALVDSVRAQLAKGRPATAAILLPAANGTSAPGTCGDKPYAAVFDMDETAVLNLGYEYNDAQTGATYDTARWSRWEASGAEKVAAVPGARRAFVALRAMGVTPIINTNRNAAGAVPTARALAFAGLGDFKHQETLFLKGDADGKSAKDGRRAAIAARWCVLALGGDQLGDFTDALGTTPAARRRSVSSSAYADWWGRRWFVLPNPVYGTGLGSGWDDTFPASTRWTDPGDAASVAQPK
ncbi:HAD family acid phosphatase [Sphingomonas dokdonensis]|uniref:Lipoprotein E n=1 Tax=Sphingomonas dokdonensis TaxID=344880 RepID=A0A245ZNK0_9SPHN|nr:HAD family acid phosphatase [Sphingomonas dokdonensis]OWK31320.1 lipoprotein E precursor [Sphingomonas dokdonensis]